MGIREGPCAGVRQRGPSDVGSASTFEQKNKAVGNKHTQMPNSEFSSFIRSCVTTSAPIRSSSSAAANAHCFPVPKYLHQPILHNVKADTAHNRGTEEGEGSLSKQLLNSSLSS